MSSKWHETTGVVTGLLYNFTIVKMKGPNKTHWIKKYLLRVWAWISGTISWSARNWATIVVMICFYYFNASFQCALTKMFWLNIFWNKIIWIELLLIVEYILLKVRLDQDLKCAYFCFQYWWIRFKLWFLTSSI